MPNLDDNNQEETTKIHTPRRVKSEDKRCNSHQRSLISTIEKSSKSPLEVTHSRKMRLAPRLKHGRLSTETRSIRHVELLRMTMLFGSVWMMGSGLSSAFVAPVLSSRGKDHKVDPTFRKLTSQVQLFVDEDQYPVRSTSTASVNSTALDATVRLVYRALRAAAGTGAASASSPLRLMEQLRAQDLFRLFDANLERLVYATIATDPQQPPPVSSTGDQNDDRSRQTELGSAGESSPLFFASFKPGETLTKEMADASLNEAEQHATALDSQNSASGDEHDSSAKTTTPADVATWLLEQEQTLKERMDQLASAIRFKNYEISALRDMAAKANRVNHKLEERTEQRASWATKQEKQFKGEKELMEVQMQALQGVLNEVATKREATRHVQERLHQVESALEKQTLEFDRQRKDLHAQVETTERDVEAIDEVRWNTIKLQEQAAALGLELQEQAAILKLDRVAFLDECAALRDQVATTHVQQGQALSEMEELATNQSLLHDELVLNKQTELQGLERLAEKRSDRREVLSDMHEKLEGQELRKLEINETRAVAEYEHADTKLELLNQLWRERRARELALPKMHERFQAQTQHIRRLVRKSQQDAILEHRRLANKYESKLSDMNSTMAVMQQSFIKNVTTEHGVTQSMTLEDENTYMKAVSLPRARQRFLRAMRDRRLLKKLYDAKLKERQLHRNALKVKCMALQGTLQERDQIIARYQQSFVYIGMAVLKLSQKRFTRRSMSGWRKLLGWVTAMKAKVVASFLQQRAAYSGMAAMVDPMGAQIGELRHE